MPGAFGCLPSQIPSTANVHDGTPAKINDLPVCLGRKEDQNQFSFVRFRLPPARKLRSYAKLKFEVKAVPVKSEARKSSKSVSYGGCIPSMLLALETCEDLDEALKPWEENLNSKERTIILKEQTDWKRALDIFNWFKRKGCYEMNVIHYNVMIRILGQAQNWDLIGSLWRDMQENRITPTNSTYGTLINAYCKGGLSKDALVWLSDLYKHGMEPDEVTMGVVLQTYKKAGNFQNVEQFFKRWSSDVFDDCESQKCYSLYTYNTLIDTYGKSGQFEKASKTFAQMLREGIVPDIVTFNTMIHMYGNNGLLEEVSALMMIMDEYQCVADTRTYNILISIHLKINDLSIAVGYFSKLKLAGLEPDVVSYRTILYAYSIRNMVGEAEVLIVEMECQGLEIDEYTQSALTRMYINVGMIDKSWSWFEKFSDKMNSEWFASNIDAFGEQGHIFLAEKAFACCLSRQKLSVIAFNVMIKAYGTQRDYAKACELFDDMIEYGIHPDKCTYTSLIHILLSTDLPHKAVCYLRKMQEGGLVSDCIPYSAVMTSFVKFGEIQIAEDIFKEMVSFGFQPDVVAYSILINAFTEVGNVSNALKYVDAMKRAGVILNPVICNLLIKLYAKNGYLREAQEVYELINVSENGPDIYASNCMISLYSENIMLNEAEAIFYDLKNSGKANEFSYGTMLCFYKKLGRLLEADLVAQDMQALELLSSTVSCNSLIALYATNGRMKQAVEIFHYMLATGIQPDESTFKTFGHALLKYGVSKEAVNRLESMRAEKSRVGLDAWIDALCSIFRLDSVDLKRESRNMNCYIKKP